MNNCHVIDVFMCSLDQVGLLEMRPCVERTGGLSVMGDSFGQSVFKESFKRAFSRHPPDAPECDAGHLTSGFAATLEVLTSREFKVCGAIGPCSSLKRKSPSVAETEIGEGGSYAWSMGGITQGTTIALYFEVANKDSQSLTPGKRRFLQLVTRYQHSSGRYRMRVTTVSGPWHTDPANNAALGASFDQEAAAVLLARIAIYRTHTEELGDILRWLDRSLIRLCSKVRQPAGPIPSPRGSHRAWGPLPCPAPPSLSFSLSVCRVPQGRTGELPPPSRVLHLPAVHVPPSALAVPAAGQQLAG